MRSMSRLIATALLVAVLALVAVGCGSTAKKTTTTGGGADGGSVSTTTTAKSSGYGY